MSTTSQEGEQERPSTPKTVRRPPRREVIEHWLDLLREIVDHPFDLSEEEIARLLNEDGEIPRLRH